MMVTRIERAVDRMTELQESGLSVAQAIHRQVLRGGAPARALADLLHGTWLGHPLHPVLTDIPIGAWTLAALCDLAAALGDSPDASRMADTLLGIGTAAAVPTALAGMADYSTIPQEAASTGALHGLLNGTALALYVLALRDRRSGNRGRGVLLSTLAFGIVGASAALGGDLVYRHKVGVNHSPPSESTDSWTDVLAEADLPDGQPRRVELSGVPVLLYRAGRGETIQAISAVCTHAGGPLDEGVVENGCVECPWHNSVFSLADGRVVHGPATLPQPSYRARVRNGRIELRAQQPGD